MYPWRKDGAPDERLTTTWSIQPAKGPLPTPRAGTVNYHVADIDAMVAQLEAEGVTVEERMDESYGRFAWIHDPEGNRIELYQELAAQGSGPRRRRCLDHAAMFVEQVRGLVASHALEEVADARRDAQHP